MSVVLPEPGGLVIKITEESLALSNTSNSLFRWIIPVARGLVILAIAVFFFPTEFTPPRLPPEVRKLSLAIILFLKTQILLLYMLFTVERIRLS
jgi:hypothetical protein